MKITLSYFNSAEDIIENRIRRLMNNGLNKSESHTALHWGIVHEDQARRDFQLETGLTVISFYNKSINSIMGVILCPFMKKMQK